jgi:hypothetical protein
LLWLGAGTNWVAKSASCSGVNVWEVIISS